MKQRHRFGIADLVASVGISFVLGAVLFPVFAQPRGSGSYAYVVDADGKRVAGATLRFRDSNGSVVGTFITGTRGEVRWRELFAFDRKGWSVDGYGVARSFGRRDWYFSPLRLHLVQVRTTADVPMPNLVLNAHPRTRTYSGPGVESSYLSETNGSGVCNLGIHPVSARFDFQSDDPKHWVVGQTATPNANGVQYVVTVAPSATIRGKVISHSGATLGGWNVSAVSEERNALTVGRSAVVGTEGRFEVLGLAPDRYRISARPRGQFQQEITVAHTAVQSGQTVWAGVLTTP